MYHFATETVFNDLTRFSVIDNTSVINDPGVPSGSKALFVKKINKFIDTNTNVVWKTLGTAAVNEVAAISLPAQTYAAGVYRLNLDVITSGSYPIDYDRWAINKGKPFYIEVYLPTQAADAKAFADYIGPYLTKGLQKTNGEKITDITIVTTSATGTPNTGTITINAQNEYLRFKSVTLEQYLADPVITTEYEFQTIVTGTTTTAGKEGFGTSWFLTKNLRLPTNEAIRFQGEDQDERPVVGVIYNQYVLEYQAQRNIGSLDYVGGQGTSKTIHVFYVPQSLASTFEGYVTSAFGAGKLEVSHS